MGDRPAEKSRGKLAEQLRRKAMKFALAELPASDGLDTTDFSEVMSAYGNWRSRQIRPVPRNVSVSKELSTTWPYPEALGELQRRLTEGTDVSPFLSQQSGVGFDDSDPERNDRRRDRDLLLAEWGIHHFHLSLEKGRGEKLRRTRDLLFAIVTDERAFLINVYPHGSWTKRELISITTRNWPDEDLVPASRIAIGLSQDFTEEEHLELRSSGASVSVFVDGRAYIGFGQTLDGTPMPVARDIMNLQHSIESADAQLPLEMDGEFAYWVPEVREPDLGVSSRGRFLSVARLPGSLRKG